MLFCGCLQLLSYGGRLSYTLAFFALDGVGLANHEPQVLMRGGHLRKLVIYTDAPAPENGVRAAQEVPLTEVSPLTSPLDLAGVVKPAPFHRGSCLCAAQVEVLQLGVR